MSKIDKRFIVQLQGKDFVTYEGLLDLAHQNKLKTMKTEIIQFPTSENNNQCIVKAIATTEDEKHFEGYGDADSSNVNRMIAKHLIRMAETRAKARALRDLTNVGMTAVEEMGGEDDSLNKNKNKNANINKTTKKNLSEGQIKRLYAIAYSKNIDANTVKEQVKKRYNKEVTELTKQEYDNVCNGYEKLGA